MKRLLWRSSLFLLLAASASALTPPPWHISQVMPLTGNPHGGETVIIKGAGFIAPVRVLLEIGGVRQEAFVIALTYSEIRFITPSVLIASPGQQVIATIHVVVNAGTEREVTLTARDVFTYRKQILQPNIAAVAPSSGPMTGGTRATIFGDGFQPPVQVELIAAGGKTAEVQVIDVAFGQIVVVMPPAADLDAKPNERVAVRVQNINSDTETMATAAFRYSPGMVVLDVSPAVGPVDGGSTIRIIGSGFRAPAAVIVAGVPALVIRITGTEILARTSPANATSCNDVRGPVQVFDIETGDLGEGPQFRYVVQPAVITGLAPLEATVGQDVSVRVGNSIAQSPITYSIANAAPLQAFVRDGQFTFRVPETVSFPKIPCLVNGQPGAEPRPFDAELRITNAFGCSNSAVIRLVPPEPVACAAWPVGVEPEE